MKKFFQSILAAFIAVIALTFAACGGTDVEQAIGDGKIENDAVRIKYNIADKLENGYELKCTVSAEKDADLNRDFVFTFASSDPVFGSKEYSETVLFEVKGSSLAEKKKNDGSYGDITISFVFDDLSKFFEQTDSEKEFHLVLHEKDTTWDVTKWNDSDFSYTYDGSKVKITK